MRTKIPTVRYALETICYKLLFCGQVFRKNIKFCKKFEEKIKNWKCETCIWELSRTYEQNLDFI